MSEQQPESETKAVAVELLATVDLGPEIEGMAGRELRMRMVTIEPGGVFGPVHDHRDRPGLVYILQGTITDHRDGVTTDYGPGVGWPEDRNFPTLAREPRNDSGGGDLGRYRHARIAASPTRPSDTTSAGAKRNSSTVLSGSRSVSSCSSSPVGAAPRGL